MIIKFKDWKGKYHFECVYTTNNNKMLIYQTLFYFIFKSAAEAQRILVEAYSDHALFETTHRKIIIITCWR